MNLNQQPANESVDPSKRRLLGGLVAGVTLTAAGIMGAKLIEGDNSISTLHEHFKGQEQSYSHAQEAVDLLITEMGTKGLIQIKTIGDGSDKVAYLRDFITNHMTSDAARPYEGSVKDDFRKGVYTKELLLSIKEEAAKYKK